MYQNFVSKNTIDKKKTVRKEYFKDKLKKVCAVVLVLSTLFWIVWNAGKQRKKQTYLLKVHNEKATSIKSTFITYYENSLIWHFKGMFNRFHFCWPMLHCITRIFMLIQFHFQAQEEYDSSKRIKELEEERGDSKWMLPSLNERLERVQILSGVDNSIPLFLWTI